MDKSILLGDLNNNYKLIDPIINDKIYNGVTISQCAKQSYNDLNNAKVLHSLSTFTLQNLETSKLYTFKIHKNQSGGNANDDIMDEIINIKKRLTILEKNKEGNIVKNDNVEHDDDTESVKQSDNSRPKDDACTIM